VNKKRLPKPAAIHKDPKGQTPTNASVVGRSLLKKIQIVAPSPQKTKPRTMKLKLAPGFKGSDVLSNIRAQGKDAEAEAAPREPATANGDQISEDGA
jgi:hypothetical protein